MEVTLNLEGSISFKENNATKGFEQVPATFVVDFKIDSDGDISVSPVSKTFKVTIYNYDEASDTETPDEKEYIISKVVMKGYILKSVIPQSFSFDKESGILTLQYL